MAANPASKAARLTPLILAGITLVAFLVHLGYGSTAMLWPQDVLRELVRGLSGDNENNVVWLVRLPRALGCILVGAILAGVGSAFQSLFRNPLADPYVVGVSSGAAAGGVLAIILGMAGFLGGLGVHAFAFVGGMLSLGLVLGLSSRRGATNVVNLLLAGVVVGAMLSGLLSLFILATGRDANQLLRWLLGSTNEMSWMAIAALSVATVVGGGVLILQARALNAFAIGEETARRLGVDTAGLKRRVLIVGTAMTAIAVGAAGVVAFLGLVAPHISRSLLGMDWRRSLGGSMLVGSALMLLADLLAQRVIPLASSAVGLAPVVDLPVGVVTALIGAPSLLLLLKRAR